MTTTPESGPAALRSGPRLVHSVAWTVSGTLIFALSQWAVVALSAKLAGASGLGQFTFAGAVVAPILAFAQVQLRAVLATDARYETRLRDFLEVRAWLTLAMLAVTPLVAVLVTGDTVTIRVIIAFVTAKAFDSVADILYGYHQRREDMRSIAVGQYVNGGLSVLLFGVVLLLTRNIVLATWGYAAASALTLLLWALPVSIRARRQDVRDPRDQPRARAQLLRAALPLGFVMVLAGLAANLPRYAVQHFMGESALGLFGGAAYMVTVGTNVITAIGQAASPRLAKYAAAGRRADFGRMLVVLVGAGLGIAFLGTIIAALWGGDLLKLLYTAEFGRHGAVLLALSAAAILSFPASLLAVAATAARSFRAQLPVFAAVLVTGAAACYLMVPAWGLIGAAAATALMALVQLAGCAWLVRSAVWRHS